MMQKKWLSLVVLSVLAAACRPCFAQLNLPEPEEESVSYRFTLHNKDRDKTIGFKFQNVLTAVSKDRERVYRTNSDSYPSVFISSIKTGEESFIALYKFYPNIADKGLDNANYWKHVHIGAITNTGNAGEVVVATDAGELLFIDTAFPRIRTKIMSLVRFITALQCSCDGNFIAGLARAENSTAYSMIIWASANGKQIANMPVEGAGDEQAQTRSRRLLSANAHPFFAVREFDSVSLYDFNGRLQAKCQGDSKFLDMSLTYDDKFLYTVNADGYIEEWKTSDGKRVRSKSLGLEQPQDISISVAQKADIACVTVNAEKNLVITYDLKNMEVVKSLIDRTYAKVI